MATLVMMSETDTLDLHAIRHHQPSGCGRESSELSEYHQRKHFEGRSHRSCHLITFLFLPLQPWSGMGGVVCHGDRYAGLAEGNGDKKSIDGSLEPPVYMLASLVKLIC